jgi:hypothetical protein
MVAMATEPNLRLATNLRWPVLGLGLNAWVEAETRVLTDEHQIDVDPRSALFSRSRAKPRSPEKALPCVDRRTSEVSVNIR